MGWQAVLPGRYRRCRAAIHGCPIGVEPYVYAGGRRYTSGGGFHRLPNLDTADKRRFGRLDNASSDAGLARITVQLGVGARDAMRFAFGGDLAGGRIRTM